MRLRELLDTPAGRELGAVTLSFAERIGGES